MEVVRGVAFDLDDTLYLERDYVAGGFRAVAEAVAEGGEAAGVFEFLWSGFLAGVRGDTFDRLLARYPALGARWKVAELIELYHRQRPAISLLPGVRELLSALSAAGVRLAIITDGSVTGQSNKVTALGIAQTFEPVIISDSWGIKFRKPHERAYRALMEQWKIPAAQMAYVGDNPEKDFLAPRRLGWQTARLRLKDQLRCGLEPAAEEYAPAHEFPSVGELAIWLRAVCALPPAQVEAKEMR